METNIGGRLLEKLRKTMAALAVPFTVGDGSVEEKSWRGSSGGEEEGRYLERKVSEEQCGLMMEALRRELEEIKNQLAWLTYHLDESSEPATEKGNGESETHNVRSPSSRLSGVRSGADTPHTAKKKMEKAKEAIERATKAALAEKERKKHFLEVVDRAENDQKKFSDEYLRLLQTHVEQQRHQVQENSRRLLKKMRARERKEKALRVQSKPARFRSLPSNDDTSFLKKLYHSTYYQIIGIELQMKKAGKLKRLSDLKEFWELMLDLPTPHPPTPRLSVKKATPTLHEPHPRPAEDDDENEEYKSWALTDLPPEHNVKEPRSLERGGQKSQKLSEPLCLPKVRPVASLLSDSSTAHDNSQKEKVRTHWRKMERVERSRHHTRHMYQQARANERAMRKLLPDIGSLGLTTTEDGRDTCDVSSHQKEPSSRPKDLSSSTGSSKSRKTRTSSKFQERQTLSTHKEVEYTEPLERHESAVVPDAEKDGATPLTMTTLLETGSVKEPKGKSALWSNYK